MHFKGIRTNCCHPARDATVMPSLVIDLVFGAAAALVAQRQLPART
jgi:hypothetical protein